MEVHHHPQIREKKMKEYLFEGLMIFIAVMLGFFAENLRETLSDNEHARQLTGQLEKDLIKDTLNLHSRIDFELNQQKKLDTLHVELQKPFTDLDYRHIQQLIGDSYGLHLFYPADAAASAIRNELHLKQFSNSELPAILADYQNEVGRNRTQENVLIQLIEDNLQPFIYRHFTPENAYSYFRDDAIKENKMRNLTQDDVDDLSVKLELINALITTLTNHDRKQIFQAAKLIDYVHKRYNPQQE